MMKRWFLSFILLVLISQIYGMEFQNKEEENVVVFETDVQPNRKNMFELFSKQDCTYQYCNMLQNVLSYLNVLDLKEVVFVGHPMEKLLLKYFEAEMNQFAQYSRIISEHTRYTLERIDRDLATSFEHLKDHQTAEICSSVDSHFKSYARWIYFTPGKETFGASKVIQMASIMIAFMIRYSLLRNYWLSDFKHIFNSIFPNCDFSGSIIQLRPVTVYDIQKVNGRKKIVAVVQCEFSYILESSQLFTYESYGMSRVINQLKSLPPFFVCPVKVEESIMYEHLLFRIDQLVAVVSRNTRMNLVFQNREEGVFITRVKSRRQIYKHPFFLKVRARAKKDFVDTNNDPVGHWLKYDNVPAIDE